MEKANVLHHACPQTYTPENLAQWITENQKATITHVDKIPLTDEEITELEHKSSVASRAIDRLNDVLAEFKEYIQNGTEFDGEEYQPKDITIPPTKGMKELKANREFADGILERGYNEETTEVYIIPYPDESLMVAVDIEGFECWEYTKKMTATERELYGKLFVKDEDGVMRQLPTEDISVNGETANIKVPKKSKKKSDEEEPFI
jgi:hypothetical protein